MSYTAKISSKNPMAVVVMVDQSGSMAEHISWNGTQTTKAIAVSEVINNLLGELTSRSRSESEYRHYYDIMVVGYCGSEVKSLLEASDDHFMTPAQLMGSIKRTQKIQRQRRLPDGRNVMTNVNQNIWVEITAEGRTPMRAAFKTVFNRLKGWCSTHRESFPPMVINITDGEVTDASPEQLIETVEKLKSLTTYDGNVLVMNVHLSNISDKSVLFAQSVGELPQDRYSELIFRMSSIMPPLFQREIAAGYDHDVPGEYRGMAYNASMSDLVRLLNIGSTTINNIVSQ